MKLLFVFCCLSAGCFIWTEASPFFFNIQNPNPPRNTQIQRQPVVSQGTNFGFGSFITKWFPGLYITKQIGTRRPKATQRPVIEVTTVFVPVDLEKEYASTSTTNAPAELIDSSIEEAEKTPSTTTTEKPFEEINNYTDEEITTSTTTTAVPFEEIQPFTESKTSTTTTELPYEETEPLTENGSPTTSTNQAPDLFTGIQAVKPTETTSELPQEESGIFTNNKIPTTSTAEGYEPFSEFKTELPLESETSTTTNAESLINQIGFTNDGDTTSSSSKTDGYMYSGSVNQELATIKPTTYRPAFVPTTTPNKTPTNLINTGGYVDSNQPPDSYEYVRPGVSAFIPTTTTNAPWKETPTNLINTGGYVDSNKPPDSYTYVRPSISADDILLNEVAPKSRPFDTLSLVGTTSTGNRIERVYTPQANRAFNERPRVTFYSNY